MHSSINTTQNIIIIIPIRVCQTPGPKIFISIFLAQVAIFNGLTELFTSMNLDEPCWR